MTKFKSGFVSIIGRTNVGKSTLINTIIGEKVAAVVNKSQTTRTAIKAIVNRENSQIIFIDTPGIHKPKTKLGEIMLDTTYKVIKDVELVVLLIDATSTQINKGDNIILEKLHQDNKKVILVINKIDLVKKEHLLELINIYKNAYDFQEIIPISAKSKKDTEKLLEEIEKLLPEGPIYYDKDEFTDQTERQLIEEIIREKSLQLLSEEIPHGIYVETEKMQLSKTKKKEKIYNINACIYCIRESHKGIIIGKNGDMLKKIATASRYEMEKLLQTKVNLSVWVKVDKDWQNKNNVVDKFKLK